MLDASILIATRDRAPLLRATLEHLRRQARDGVRFEVIVVDNGSRDATAEVLDEMKLRLPLVALAEPAPGKSRALNRALEVAQGDLLVFTDDDVAPGEGWLERLVAAARRWRAMSLFCGPIEPDFPAGAPQWLREHRFCVSAFARFARPESAESVLPPDVLPFGPNFAVRASAMAGIRFNADFGPNGGDYAMGGETEMLKRLAARGERAVWLPEARVLHHVAPHQLELAWLFARSMKAGRGNVRLAPDRAAPRIFGAPRYLWRAVVQLGARHALARLGTYRTRFEAGRAFYRAWGQLREYLDARAKARAGRAPSAAAPPKAVARASPGGEPLRRAA